MTAKPNETTDASKQPSMPIDTSEIDNSLAELQPPKYRPIDISFFSYQDRKSTQLVGNTNEELAIQGKHNWNSFDLKRVLYVNSLCLNATGYSEGDEAEISFVDPFNQSETRIGSKFSNGKFSFDVQQFIKGFGLRPQSKWMSMSSTKLVSVELFGLEPREFKDIIHSFNNLNELKSQIQDDCKHYNELAVGAEKRASEFDAAINSKQKKSDSITATLDALQEKLDSQNKAIEATEKELESRKQQLSQVQSTLTQLDDQVEKKSEDRKQINAEVANASAQLSELKRDIYLFPSEIAGYSRQGTRNIWAYLVMSLVPFAILGAVTQRLFWNSENLLRFFVDHPQTPITSYLISRMPYAAVSVAILTICYAILHKLLAEIININRRKQELHKISIIATDVSFASQHGLTLTDEQSYNLRTETKMEFLKEHLKQNLSDEYSYGPAKGLGAKLMEFAKQRLEKNIEDDEADKPNGSKT